MWRFPVLAIFALIMATSLASAATVHGTVYNLLLEPQGNVIVEVNSIPKQTFISKDGDYSFNLANGNYIITAKYSADSQLISSANESISIVGEGDFVLDFILFDETDEDFELLDNSGIDIDAEEKSYVWLFILILLLATTAFGIFFYLRNKPIVKETNRDSNSGKSIQKEELENVLSIIKSESGRITQKELRKKLNLSEAKVSLMVAELESLGNVKKIKQGRGNIIVLT